MVDTLKIEMWKVLGFNSKEEYQEYLAKEKEYEPFVAHEKRITRQQEQSTIRTGKRLRSDRERREEAAIKQGFKNPYEQKLHHLKERGFPSIFTYEQHLAKEKFARQKGFESYAAYEEHLVKESIRTIEEQEHIVENILCSSIENVVSMIKDPESIFHDKEFIKRITTLNRKLSCDIPIT